VIKPYVTRASGELMSTTVLREPVAAILTAAPSGIGEAMLVHLVRAEDNAPLGAVAPAYAVDPDDRWVWVTRQTCRMLGAECDECGVWSLA
jgi:hypothetical protein